MAIVLYRKQREIIDFICQFIQKHGAAPTFREIAKAINVSSLATVHEHLQTLERKGVIRREKGTMRAIEVIDKNLFRPSKGIELPILGLIAAGQPIEAEAAIKDIVCRVTKDRVVAGAAGDILDLDQRIETDLRTRRDADSRDAA